MIKLVSGRGYLFAAQVFADKASLAPDGIAAHPEAAFSAQGSDDEPMPDDESVAELEKSQRSLFGLRGPAAIAAVAGLSGIIGLAVAAPVLRPDLIFKRTPPVIAVIPIADGSDDPQGAAMAGGITDRLVDGFARIDNIRVVASQSEAAGTRPQHASASSTQPNFIIRGELQRDRQSWTLQTRMIRTATGEVQSVASVSVDINEDLQLQQSRLAAGAGHPLAQRLNELLETSESSAARNAKVVIKQATK